MSMCPVTEVTSTDASTLAQAQAQAQPIMSASLILHLNAERARKDQELIDKQEA